MRISDWSSDVCSSDLVVAKAEGDASRFDQLLTEYRKAKNVTKERLYLDMMKSVLGGSSKILIDADKSNPMLYLPLDQMLKNAPRKSSGGDSDYVTIPTPPSSRERKTTLLNTCHS